MDEGYGIYSVAMFQEVKHFRCRGLNAYGIKCFWTFYPLYFTGQTKYDNSNFWGFAGIRTLHFRLGQRFQTKPHLLDIV